MEGEHWGLHVRRGLAGGGVVVFHDAVQKEQAFAYLVMAMAVLFIAVEAQVEAAAIVLLRLAETLRQLALDSGSGHRGIGGLLVSQGEERCRR
jgi:hypothetical protein